MQLEGGKISSTQMVFLVIGFLIGTSAIFSPGGSAGRDTWLAILGGTLEAVILLGMYLSVSRRYPSKTLVEICDIILGPILGKVVSVIYIWYFFHAGSMELRVMGEFVSALMPDTPMDVFLVTLAVVCGIAVLNGIEVMGRYGVILVLVYILVVVTNSTLLYSVLDFSNLLPLLDIPWPRFVLSAHSAASYPLGEILLFMMIIPVLNKPAQASRSILTGLGIACLLFVAVAVRNVAALGGYEEIAVYPTLSTIRLINVGDILTRMEALVAIDLITIGFLKVALFFYASALGLAQLFKLHSYLPLVPPMTVLMYILSLSSFQSGVEIPYYAYNIWPFYSIPFVILLPLLTLLVAVIRKFPHRGES